MDKKKTLKILLCTLGVLIATVLSPSYAQSISRIKFCDKKYEYGVGKDSITLFFNVYDEGKPIKDLTDDQLRKYLVLKEEGVLIGENRARFSRVTTGQRIPSELTLSILVDLSIPLQGKERIFDAIKSVVDYAPDGCVYLSFFGDNVTSSLPLTKDNINESRYFFQKRSENKYFYGALYAKLAEFNSVSAEYEENVLTSSDYRRNQEIAHRAGINPDKNVLFIFTEGHKSPSFEKSIQFHEVTDYQNSLMHVVPTVYAFYYTEEGEDTSIMNVLQGVCNPKVEGRGGKYLPADNMNRVLEDFKEVVNDQMFDYSVTYKATKSKRYSGKTAYSAEWKGTNIGDGFFSIGAVERSWPEYSENAADTAKKILVAILATLLTMLFFFALMKVLIPFIQSKAFELKYYRKYVPDDHVTRRICHYCGAPLVAGQTVVVRCKHIIHDHCWKQNGYMCPEYGQNCKDGIQAHVDWNNLFRFSTLKDYHQTITGILAGFLSWVFYELIGDGCFERFARFIVSVFYSPQEGLPDLTSECLDKTSAFLTIGFLLGFFLSMIFRYHDEYGKMDWKEFLKIVALSLLSGAIGVAAFAIGADILCSMLSLSGLTYIPWYCSFPAYLLFSISIVLSLSIKSSIPLKSALIGGGVSAIIGFFVLYFARFSNFNILLDFIIYGGGLGASLVTVRMLAEKYFLVIRNGVNAGRSFPIHKWMNATGGNHKVTIGMTRECEIQMNWEKSNLVAKEHAVLYIDYERKLPMIKPLAEGVVYNSRAELPVGKPHIISNGDTFTIGNTIFQYDER